MTASLLHLPVTANVAVDRARTILSYADDLEMVNATLEEIPAADLPDVIRALASRVADLLDIGESQGADLWTEVCG